MEGKRSGFINVDALMPNVSLEQAARYYGVTLPELHHVGSEVRSQCFLNCGQCEETGHRALAIKLDHPAKQWKCHHYGCGRGGNFIGLCDLMKGGRHADGRPRGERFKEIAGDLQAMADGGMAPLPEVPAEKQPSAKQVAKKPAEPECNVPLAKSDNERARELVNLDERLVVEIGDMSKPASLYFRKRPFLTPEVCRRWRMGYMPRDAKSTLRGLIVYPMRSENGEVLAWVGRDASFEEKHTQWIAAGRQGPEPVKHRFPKGFHRGLEVFGQHRLGDGGLGEQLAATGLIVVEGPNDVIRLDTLGVPSVGLCSNHTTKEQATKIARYAKELAGGTVTLMLDNDLEGEHGAQTALWEIAQHGVQVRLAWSRTSHGGKFAERQPEALTEEEWSELRA